MSRTTAYSMLNVAASIDGLKIGCLWDGDDAITIEQASEVGVGLVGADGCAVFSQSANKSANITLRLQHSSATHRQLVQKWKQQRAGRLIGFPFDLIDRNSGEGGTADKCFIASAPVDQAGVNATARTWVLWTGHWEPQTPNQNAAAA